MPEEYKFDTGISTLDAYKMYIASKPTGRETTIFVCPNVNLIGFDNE